MSSKGTWVNLGLHVFSERLNDTADAQDEFNPEL